MNLGTAEGVDAEAGDGRRSGIKAEGEVAVVGAADGITTDELSDEETTPSGGQRTKTTTQAIQTFEGTSVDPMSAFIYV